MPTIMMNTVVNNGNPKGPRISTEDTASIKKVLNRLSNTLRIPAKIYDRIPVFLCLETIGTLECCSYLVIQTFNNS